MGLLDALKNGIGSAVTGQGTGMQGQPYGQPYGQGGILGQVVSQLAGANPQAAGIMGGMTGGKQETFKFKQLPHSLFELQQLPESKLDTPYKSVALCMLTLLNFGYSVNNTWEMLEWLNGPDDLKNQRKQFIMERLKGKMYKVSSFFSGATPANNYQPTMPYTITVISNQHSFTEPNWATLYVKSGGADAPRPIRLRHKPSTNQWFINEIQCLGDIRLPGDIDEWA